MPSPEDFALSLDNWLFDRKIYLVHLFPQLHLSVNLTKFPQAVCRITCLRNCIRSQTHGQTDAQLESTVATANRRWRHKNTDLDDIGPVMYALQKLMYRLYFCTVRKFCKVYYFTLYFISFISCHFPVLHFQHFGFLTLAGAHVCIDALWVGDTLGIPTTYGQLVSSFIVLILRVCVRTM